MVHQLQGIERTTATSGTSRNQHLNIYRCFYHVFPSKIPTMGFGFNLPQFMDGLNGFNGLELIRQMFCHRIRCCKEHETTHHLSQQPWICNFGLQTTACSLLVPENPLFFLDRWASFCKTSQNYRSDGLSHSR